jgi:CheY-like chemotaxis protein
MAKLETVLIVEDEAVIALDLAQSLTEMGFNPIVAGSVVSALLIIQSRKVDFAILDYRLGERTTDQIATILREDHVPFVLCSGSQLGLAGRVFEGVPLIPKPYTQDLLRTAIQSAIN